MTQFEMMTSTELSGSGICSISPFRNSTLVDARLPLVLARQREHLVGHVEPVRLAGRADAPRRQQHVDAAAGAEIEHGLARLQLGERRRIAAAERRDHGFDRQRADLLGAVQIRRDRVAAARAAATARILVALADAPGGLAVFLLHDVSDVGLADVVSMSHPFIFAYANICGRGIFVKANMSKHDCVRSCCTSRPAPRLKGAAELATLFRALADETRLRILALLRDGEVCVCHIQGGLQLPQPTISRHLAYLRQERPGRGAARRDLDALSALARRLADREAGARRGTARAHALAHHRSRSRPARAGDCKPRRDHGPLRVRAQRGPVADGGGLVQRRGRSREGARDLGRDIAGRRRSIPK